MREAHRVRLGQMMMDPILRQQMLAVAKAPISPVLTAPEGRPRAVESKSVYRRPFIRT